ncbi:MAG: YgjP-like metallopeptidase domain-containing protein [Ramlibacter sp.]
MQPVPLKYLRGYPEPLQAQVRQLLADGGVAPLLRRKYPALHGVRTDRALYDYVMDLKASYLRSSEPLAKVCFDGKLQQVAQALGTHTVTARVQGSKLKTRREIRVATVFREAPEPFLKMITVHELAHLKIREHDKAFYSLCTHMAPDYHQLEFDVRLYLTHLEAQGEPPWA